MTDSEKVKAAKKYLKRLYGISSEIAIQNRNLRFYSDIEGVALDDIRRYIVELSEKREEIIKQINSLNDTGYIRVLYLRYAENKNPVQVSIATGYSQRQVFRLQKDGLEAFYDKYLGADSDG